MVRKNIAAGNWKMNTNLQSAKELIMGLKDGDFPSETRMIIGVPFVYLSHAVKWVEGSRIEVAAQNCHPAEKGAFTGEVSIQMLKDIGVQTVIIGHSERREIFGESNTFIREKVDALLSNEVEPIFCCGEPLSVRKAGSQNHFVEKQLMESLFHLDQSQISKIVIAYEPIWAIGTGETASPQQAEDMHAHIRSLIAANYGNATADGISILYGGSVKSSNAKDLFSNRNVDGGLVGGAALDAEGFLQIANSF
jgi:triosephosphate isomerase